MKKKVLLMGKSGSGKTSMRSIIFTNYIDLYIMEYTVDVEHSHVRFLGNLVLNLWDCGGQVEWGLQVLCSTLKLAVLRGNPLSQWESFMENYITSQRDHIFKNVQVLIFVFDVDNTETDKELYYYKQCLEALQQNSSDAKIFCLIHKMDLIPEEQKDSVFKQRENELKQLSLPFKISCCKTSIWDETLYKAWSSIVYSLIPNVKVVESKLQKFCDICEADEMVLFEKATFLVISNVKGTNKEGKEWNSHRFEKISNIIKQFKLSCSKSQSQLMYMEVRNSEFSAMIDAFTANTHILVVSSDPNIKMESTLLNIGIAKKHFDKWINS